MKLILAFVLLIACLQYCPAQQAARLTEASVEYDKRKLPSLRLTLEAPVDAVYEPWQQFWKDRYQVDIDREDKDGSNISYLAEQAVISGFSSKNFDLYSNVSGNKESAMVSVALAFSDSDIVTRDNHADTYTAVSTALEEFRAYFYTSYFDERISETKEALEDVRDDSISASKDAEKARKKIADYENKIEKLRRKIEKTREDVGEELDTAEDKAKRVRELELELDRLQRSRKNLIG